MLPLAHCGNGSIDMSLMVKNCRGTIYQPIMCIAFLRESLVHDSGVVEFCKLPPDFPAKAWMEHIQLCFNAIAGEYALPGPAVAQWMDSAKMHYSEPHRHYHTLEHIRSMFECLAPKDISSQIQNRRVIDLAIIFHDIIYDTTSQENEFNSIRVFETFAEEMSLPEYLCKKVSQLIERAIRHELKDGDDIDAKIFLDSDLEVLSRDSDDYDLYSSQIRSEYRQFSDEQYCQGRIKILTRFLQRPRLYFSKAFAAREEKARANLANEVAKLEQQLALL